MKFSSLQKLGGIAIIFGSILFAAWVVCRVTMLPGQAVLKDFSVMVFNPNWLWITSLALYGLILMTFGFIAVYSRIYKTAGVSGFIGYLFIMVAYILQIAQVTWEVFVYPAIAGYPPALALFKNRMLFNHPQVRLFRSVTEIVILLGVILFCKALVQSKEFSKSAGILFFIGAVIYAVGSSVNMFAEITGILMLSAGCFIIGKTMFLGAKSN
jgi:hypothetical protein